MSISSVLDTAVKGINLLDNMSDLSNAKTRITARCLLEIMNRGTVNSANVSTLFTRNLVFSRVDVAQNSDTCRALPFGMERKDLPSSHRWTSSRDLLASSRQSGSCGRVRASKS